MAWNPIVYNKFKKERYAPFYDLLALISSKKGMRTIVDLGCGTGELTKMLSEKFHDAKCVLGVDSSKEMLEESKGYQNDRVYFKQRTIETQLDENAQWDLVFSNAAIQWIEDHHQLIPKMISIVKPGGQLAIQMPSQHENILNQMLLEIVQEEPFSGALSGWKKISPMLSIDHYAQILFENGCQEMNIIQKVYPLIVHDSNELFEFISGSALIPYFERFSDEIKVLFIQEYQRRIRNRFPSSPILYAFKRILIKGDF
ncbi:methyltransferase domain-containing protein [Olivibacter sp. CPCC 100613]|uniref:methyltransferase domain-containing protein n=1 Tax=Olivibacter sp. CPCC 100613 TaxID=3079931 RepID=UPI002FFAB13D